MLHTLMMQGHLVFYRIWNMVYFNYVDIIRLSTKTKTKTCLIKIIDTIEDFMINTVISIFFVVAFLYVLL